MSFRQEVRDFIHGYEAADRWENTSVDREYKRALIDAKKPYQDNPADPGLPMAGGTPMITERKGGTDSTETGSIGNYPTKMDNAGGTPFGKHIYNYYRKSGISHAVSAGLAANLMQESGGDPRVLSGVRRGDNGKSAYIAQWQDQPGGPRQSNLLSFTAERGRADGDNRTKPTLKDQLDFVLEEGNPNSKYKDVQWAKAYGGLNSINDPAEATAYIRKYFERPSADDMPDRLRHLQNVLDGTGDVTATSTDPAIPEPTTPAEPKPDDGDEETVGPETDPGGDPEHQQQSSYSSSASFELPEVAVPEVQTAYVPTDEEEYMAMLAQQQAEAQELMAGGESPWIDSEEVRPVMRAEQGGVIPEPTQYFASGGATYTQAKFNDDPTAGAAPIRRVGMGQVTSGAASNYANGALTPSQLALQKARAAPPPVAAPKQVAAAPVTDFYKPTMKQQGQMALFGRSAKDVMTPEQYTSWSQTPVTMGNRNLYSYDRTPGMYSRQQHRGGHWEQGGIIPEPEEAQSFARGGAVLQVDPNLWRKAVRRERPTSARGSEAGIYAEDTAAKRLNIGARDRVSSAIHIGENRHERRKAGRKGDQHKRGGDKRKKDKIETSSTGTPTPAQPKKGRLSDEYVRPNPTPPQPKRGRLSDEYVRPTDTPPAPGRLSDENAEPPVPGESYAGQETTPRPRPGYPYPADPGRREVGYPYPADPGRREVGYPYNPDNAIPDSDYAGEETFFRVPGEDHAGQETTPRPRPNYPYNPDNGPPPGEAYSGQEQSPVELADWYIQILQQQSLKTGIPLEVLITEARGNAAASIRDAIPEGEETTPMENPPDWYRPAQGFKRGGVVPEEDEEIGTSPRAEEANYTTSAPRGTTGPTADNAPPEGEGAEPERLQPTPTLMSAVKEAVAGGSRFIQQHFGLGGGGTDPMETGGIPDPEAGANQQAGLQRFAQGEGAATPEELQAIDQKIGLPKGMAEGDKNMERMARMMNWYLSRGRKDDAEAAAASLMMYGANRTSQLGSLAAVAYEDGNIDKTIAYLEEAYKMIPDGGSLDVTVDREAGKFYADFTNADGSTTEREVTADEIPALIQRVQNKSAYWTSVARLGDPKGAESRDIEARQIRQEDRAAARNRAETADTRAYNEKNWNYQHGVTREEELTDEQRKERAAELKLNEERGYQAGVKDTEYKRGRRDDLADKVSENLRTDVKDVEKNLEARAKEERDNEAALKKELLSAALAIKKWNLDPKNKPVDVEAFKLAMSNYQQVKRTMPTTPSEQEQEAYDEAVSRLVDTMPYEDITEKLIELEIDPDSYTYRPKSAANSDTPPAQYPDAVRGYDENGKPAWVHTDKTTGAVSFVE